MNYFLSSFSIKSYIWVNEMGRAFGIKYKYFYKNENIFICIICNQKQNNPYEEEGQNSKSNFIPSNS